ncbi:MAG TPA: class II D-tagatose-bisphosphate aldolase, non-catalytic subunit, partial [Acetobacteraceae bacterium]|nr:class II D-tagatose-bisphosphate aldolase, non-catalytic subunit [Acetobacteraceae bacterium]
PGLVFEAHSTDYQPRECLSALVADGFAILKVGPALTFALREVLYGLDEIACFLDPSWRERSLVAAMERIMLAEPAYWRSHYAGTEAEMRIQRHFSYSDRIRYYWPHPEAQAAVAALLERLDPVAIPETMVSQFIPGLYPQGAAGRARKPAEFLLEGIRVVLRAYSDAAALKRD